MKRTIFIVALAIPVLLTLILLDSWKGMVGYITGVVFTVLLAIILEFTENKIK